MDYIDQQSYQGKELVAAMAGFLRVFFAAVRTDVIGV